MSDNLTVLITGASRGIGKALVTHYLLRPATTVIAAVRTLSDPGPQSLPSLPKGPESTLITVPLDAASPSSIAAAFDTLKHTHALHHLDVVIANAGAAFGLGTKLSAIDATTLQRDVDVNAYGPLWLFQHALPLMREAAKPVFVAVSSAAGSRGLLDFTGGVPMGGYGVAKALLNAMVAKLAKEEEGVVTVVVDPGHVATDGGRESGEKLPELKEIERIPVEECVAGMAKVIAEATKEQSGQFIKYTGEEALW